eukprot:TRINITY_DN2989_c0_g1_i1.p1 TRINITY_DN2989_c0_g1~~TRINITY_DN2989_c0_g1_i1.p1  ORF type:complete len:272 (+),score=61.92 TRINITY_DN2989_c0_g1_i1:58-816(+)
MTQLIAITGANRGFGRSLAVALCKKFPQSTMLLSCRSTSKGLDETEKACMESGAKTVVKWEIDMSTDATTVRSSTMTALSPFSTFKNVMLVNNAGSLGELQNTKDLSDSVITENITSNMIAPFVVTSSFLSVFADSADDIKVVNISSLLAIKPLKGFSLYCSCKAARDMHMKVLSEEHPNVRTLNYAPGPMKTDMAMEIQTSHSDTDIQNNFKALELVDPNASAAVVAQLLSANTFTSGDHLDYYDNKHILE